MQVQHKLGPGDKSTSCMSIASASKKRMHIKEEAAHVIGLVLLPPRRSLCLQDATDDRDTNACSHNVLKLAAEVQL